MMKKVVIDAEEKQMAARLQRTLASPRENAHKKLWCAFAKTKTRRRGPGDVIDDIDQDL